MVEVDRSDHRGESQGAIFANSLTEEAENGRGGILERNANQDQGVSSGMVVNQDEDVNHGRDERQDLGGRMRRVGKDSRHHSPESVGFRRSLRAREQ